MRPLGLSLALAFFVIPSSLFPEPHNSVLGAHSNDALTGSAGGAILASSSALTPSPRPFSLAATSEHMSTLGFGFQMATNLNRYMNLRSYVNMFDFGGQSFSSAGLNGYHTQIHMASTGSSLDLYPFPSHGFRLSPGLLFHNPFLAGAHWEPSRTSFTLNGNDYYPSTIAPVSGVVTINRDSIPAFTMTTGWGNMITHGGGRFSFPVELGVAFIGAPIVKVPLSYGQVCDQQGQNCQDVAEDTQFQSDLQAQATKFGNHLGLLKTYPIVSFGVAYRFSLHPISR